MFKYHYYNIEGEEITKEEYERNEETSTKLIIANEDNENNHRF